MRYKNAPRLPVTPGRGGGKRGGAKGNTPSPTPKLRPKRQLSASAARHVGELTVKEAKIRAERVRYIGDEDWLTECDQAAEAIRVYKATLID